MNTLTIVKLSSCTKYLDGLESHRLPSVPLYNRAKAEGKKPDRHSGRLEKGSQRIPLTCRMSRSQVAIEMSAGKSASLYRRTKKSEAPRQLG